MELIEKKLKNLIPETLTTQFDFSGTYTDPDGDSHSLTIFSTSYFAMHVYILYSDRKCRVTKENSETFFQTIFNAWKTSRSPYYLKEAWILSIKYNPLDTYNIQEVLTNDTTQHTKGATNTRTFTNTDTATDTRHIKTELHSDLTEGFTNYKETETTTPYSKITDTDTFNQYKETETTTPYSKITDTDSFTNYKETETTTPYTKITDTTTPTDTTTNSRMAFNSSSLVTTDQTGRGGNITEERSYTGTEKVDKEITGSKAQERTYTGTNKVDKEITGSKAQERTYTGTNVVDKEITGSKSHTKSGYDEDIHSGAVTTAHSGAITDVGSGSDTDTRNYTKTITGNLGRLSEAEILAQEYNNLMEDLADRALKEFIDRYTYYAEEVF